ncbi:hypothetical protein GCM10009790_13130 [Georgenia ruanii]
MTHRAVAERARASLSATTYYFSGLDDLLGAAGAHLVSRWAEQAEHVRDEVREGLRRAETGGPAGEQEPSDEKEPSGEDARASEEAQAGEQPQGNEGARASEQVPAGGPEPTPELAVAAVLAALLPPEGQVRGHYQQLLAAGATPAVARAFHAGRTRLDAAIGDILAATGSRCPAALAVAVVDGAVVSALSEGRDVRKTAAELLRRVL